MYGLNRDQWKIPVIEQLIVPKPVEVTEFLGTGATTKELTKMYLTMKLVTIHILFFAGAACPGPVAVGDSVKAVVGKEVNSVRSYVITKKLMMMQKLIMNTRDIRLGTKGKEGEQENIRRNQLKTNQYTAVREGAIQNVSTEVRCDRKYQRCTQY